MARYVYGKRILRKPSLLGFKLIHYIKSEEVHWVSCLVTHHFSPNYNIKGLLTFIIKALPNARQMMIGMPKFQVEQEGVCPGCAKGKLKRGPFPSSQSKTSEILQLVHSDISGMMPVNSLGGYLYYLTFTDNYSRKTWIYFLKKKDEVFTWFRHFKALIENQAKKKIKILSTENGTEYQSNKFHGFCKEAGIKRETTTPYTPEQNGVAERKNCTIVEVVHAMIHDQRLPKFLWAEATNNPIYVQN